MKNDILFNIKELHHLIGKTMFNDINKPEYKPTATQIRFIDYLEKHSDSLVYQKDLEQEFLLSRATVSDVLNTMEKHKIITRVVSDKDTRTKKIILNERYKSLHHKFQKEILKMNELITKNIQDNELSCFNKVLNQMKDNIYEYLKIQEGNDKND